MAQIVVTLLFLLVAGAGIAVIAASLIDDWAGFMRAFGQPRALAPLPLQVRVTGSSQGRTVRFSRRPEDRRAAA